MEETGIIELYWARNERAIQETDAIYGKKLHRLVDNIVRNCEDAEESVNDTYFKTWNNASKRKADVVILTEEMELCIPGKNFCI